VNVWRMNGSRLIGDLSTETQQKFRQELPIDRQVAHAIPRAPAVLTVLHSGRRSSKPSGTGNARGRIIARRVRLPGRKVMRSMLSQCANPQCCKPFLRLREGKLFLVETGRLVKPGEPAGPPFVRARMQPREVEHFWLCDQCALRWTLVYDRERGVALEPARQPVATARAAAANAAHNGLT
jgi:hypothetical protein